MKIAYLVNHNISTNDGITKKFLGQTTAWKNLGHEVEIFCLTPIIGDSILNYAKQFKRKNAFISRIQFHNEYYNEIEKFDPDIVYFRYDTWSITLNKILNNYKVITELNTFDLGEFYNLLKQEKTIKSFVRYIAYKFLRTIVLKKIRGIIGVTKEIVNNSSNSKFGKPSIYIPNGIDLKKFHTIKVEDCNFDKIKLFFIGSPGAPWHGVDIIETIAKHLKEFEFHIVGLDGKNTENLFWHGYLDKTQYIEILRNCHICISSLGIHRNEMFEACPLKSREYLAYGYPMIMGYKDTAFIERQNPDWIYYIDPLQDTNFEELKKFIIKNKNTIVNHKEIEYIDVEKLEHRRLDFFKTI